MDFIEGLPTSDHYNSILVVVDKFSKYSHFIKLKHPFSALQIAKVYMEQVYKLHGMPMAIVSDRDKIFTSLLWKELFKLLGTELSMSIAYHPQSDGQTKRVNQCIEAYLRCFIHSCPSKWSQWLHLAEFWYNTCFHSALNHTPFEVLYGHPPHHFGIDPKQDCVIPELDDWLKQRHTITALLHQQLLRVQQKMKLQADKHRTDRSFNVGALVWLKIQLYAQSSVASRLCTKLAYRYFGPYEVEAKIGPAAYRLKLPPTSSVHPVFHVSLLKKVTGTTPIPFSPLPVDPVIMQTPEMVLDRRVRTKGHRTSYQLLIKWKGSAAELATWEEEDEILRLFPEFTAWGQAVSNGGGDVTVHKRPDSPSKKNTRLKKPNPKFVGPAWSK
jgi:hypothetical protein